MLRKLLCVQCKIGSFYIKNEQGERRLVYVMSDFTIVPKHEEESLAGFDTSVVYCLGCSWSGSPKKAVRH